MSSLDLSTNPQIHINNDVIRFPQIQHYCICLKSQVICSHPQPTSLIRGAECVLYSTQCSSTHTLPITPTPTLLNHAHQPAPNPALPASHPALPARSGRSATKNRPRPQVRDLAALAAAAGLLQQCPSLYLSPCPHYVELLGASSRARRCRGLVSWAGVGASVHLSESLYSRQIVKPPPTIFFQPLCTFSKPIPFFSNPHPQSTLSDPQALEDGVTRKQSGGRIQSHHNLSRQLSSQARQTSF